MPETNKEKKLETLIVINIMFLIAFFIFKEKSILTVSVIISLICLMSSSVLTVVYKVWNSFFSFLGEMNSKILLFIVFFLFLVPIASFKKIFSKKKTLSLDNFKNREHIFEAGDLEKMG